MGKKSVQPRKDDHAEISMHIRKLLIEKVCNCEVLIFFLFVSTLKDKERNRQNSLSIQLMCSVK